MTTFFGMYRGVVVSAEDPLARGRVQVSVPAVLGDATAWAEACVPAVRRGRQLLAIPEPSSPVWVTFEAGNPAYPIWVGRPWPSG